MAYLIAKSPSFWIYSLLFIIHDSLGVKTLWAFFATATFLRFLYNSLTHCTLSVLHIHVRVFYHNLLRCSDQKPWNSSAPLFPTPHIWSISKFRHIYLQPVCPLWPLLSFPTVTPGPSFPSVIASESVFQFALFSHIVARMIFLLLFF